MNWAFYKPSKNRTLCLMAGILNTFCFHLSKVTNVLNFYYIFPVAENGIPIKSWLSDPTDVGLLNLLPILDALRFSSDVRSVLRRNIHTAMHRT